MSLYLVIIHLVGGVLTAKNNVVQNRRKSKRLIECLEAILPPLRTIEDAESAHQETLEKLKNVVEDAKVLLEKQGKKRSLSKYLSSSSVKEQFNDITQRLQTHMQALNLSVAALQRVNANTMEADDAADRQEMQAELLEMMKNNQDELREQFADLDAGQQEKAQKMLAELTKGQDELWRNISKMTREVINNQDQLQREIMNVRDHLTGTVLNERDVILGGQEQRARDLKEGQRNILDGVLEGQEKLLRDFSDEMRKVVLEQSSARHDSLPMIDMGDLQPAGGGEDDILGAGGFGEVKKMRWMSGGAIEVAVKEILQRRPSPKALKELRKEAETMHAMRHPNVIQLYGACLTPPHVCLVLQYAPHGSLQDVLAKEGPPTGADVWRKRFFIASDILKGLIYLHKRKPKVLHMDIKSGNVMIFDRNSRLWAKLSDFGLAYIKTESASSTVRTKTSSGTVNWKAPELFHKGGKATDASDIYSCACVMYELASGVIPWDREREFSIIGYLHAGERPNKPEGCIEGFWNLIEQGWAQNPAERLPLDDALDQLESLVKEVERVDPAPEPEPEPDPTPSITSDIDVLRLWRDREPGLQRVWQGDDPKSWEGVEFDGNRVVKLDLNNDEGVITSVPAEIGQLTSLTVLGLGGNQLGGMPAEIGQLTSLEALYFYGNKLTSLPAEIGQLTSLKVLDLSINQLRSVPAEIGHLTSLKELYLGGNKLTSLPAKIGHLTSLRVLYLTGNQLRSVPAEIGQLASLVKLWLNNNKLTSAPASIDELRVRGCDLLLDEGVTIGDPAAVPPPQPTPLINSDITLGKGKDRETMAKLLAVTRLMKLMVTGPPSEDDPLFESHRGRQIIHHPSKIYETESYVLEKGAEASTSEANEKGITAGCLSMVVLKLLNDLDDVLCTGKVVAAFMAAVRITGYREHLYVLRLLLERVPADRMETLKNLVGVVANATSVEDGANAGGGGGVSLDFLTRVLGPRVMRNPNPPRAAVARVNAMFGECEVEREIELFRTFVKERAYLIFKGDNNSIIDTEAYAKSLKAAQDRMSPTGKGHGLTRDEAQAAALKAKERELKSPGKKPRRPTSIKDLKAKIKLTDAKAIPVNDPWLDKLKDLSASTRPNDASEVAATAWATPVARVDALKRCVQVLTDVAIAEGKPPRGQLAEYVASAPFPEKKDPTPKVDNDVSVLRMWRKREPTLKRKWQGADPAKWEGVTVSGDRVVVLDLSGYRLNGATAELRRLTSLEELYLGGIGLSMLPAEIEHLTSLRTLDIDVNMLKALPAWIWKLTSLKTLNLNNNQLESLPTDIGRLANLKTLNLKGNRLKMVPRAIAELRAGGCKVELDDGVMIEGSESPPPPRPKITLETIVPIVTANSDMVDIEVLRRWHKWSPKLQSKWPFGPSVANFIPSKNYLGEKRGYMYDWVGKRGVGLGYIKHADPVYARGEIMQGETLESSMQGVTLSGNRVTELEFGGWQLGMVPAEIGRLTALTVLRLGSNSLKKLPAEIGQLKSLVDLNLGSNKLTSLPAKIGQLRSLKRLWLGSNELTSLPAWIGQLRSLKVLHLSDNRLTSLLAWIGQLTSLERLDLDDNKLTSLPAEIGQLMSLEKLLLGNNQLTSLPPGIGRLTSLKKLLLHTNKLTSMSVEIWHLTSLEVLDLANNELTSLPPEIWQLTSLEVLDLANNELTSLPPEIGRLTSLKKLLLHTNKLTSLPAEIGQMIGLEELNLRGIRFEHFPDEVYLTQHNYEQSAFQIYTSWLMCLLLM